MLASLALDHISSRSMRSCESSTADDVSPRIHCFIASKYSSGECTITNKHSLAQLDPDSPSQTDQIDVGIAAEREDIVKELLKVLGSIRQVDMEPSGHSLVSNSFALPPNPGPWLLPYSGLSVLPIYDSHIPPRSTRSDRLHRLWLVHQNIGRDLLR